MLSALFAIVLSLFFNEISAQFTNATCNVPGYEWAFNSLEQSPCVMASYMLAPCRGSSTVYSLDPGWRYSGANEGLSEQCHCSSAVYSLLTVCQYCQRNTSTIVESWGVWTENCTTTDVQNGFFIPGIPAGTKIPIWAFQAFDTNETFSVIKAQQLAATNGSEFGPPLPSTVPSNYPTPSLTGSRSPSANLPSGSSSPSSEPASSSGSTPVGAIVGGVVGGVAGIAIIAALIFFLVLRKDRQRKNRMSGQSNSVQVAPWSPSPPSSSTPQTAEHKLFEPNRPPNLSYNGSFTTSPTQTYHPYKPEL